MKKPPFPSRRPFPPKRDGSGTHAPSGGKQDPPKPVAPKREAPKAPPKQQQAVAGRYFITFRTQGLKLPAEAMDAVAKAILQLNKARYTLSIAAVLPETVHMLIWQKRKQSGSFYTLEELLKSVKGSSALAVNKVLKRNGMVWQKESSHLKLRDANEWREKYAFILVSPVKAELSAIPEDYPWLLAKETFPK